MSTIEAMIFAAAFVRSLEVDRPAERHGSKPHAYEAEMAMKAGEMAVEAYKLACDERAEREETGR